MSSKKWDPLQVLLRPDEEERKIGLILLNSTLEMSPCLRTLWKKACIKVAADGAVGRLYTVTGSDRDKYIPDMVVGDFDSTEKEHLDFYSSKPECTIKKYEDQDTTDFTKALTVMLDTVESKKLPVCEIFVLGGYDGRMDHLLANLSTMHMAIGRTKLVVYMIDTRQTCFVLSKGKHSISVNSGLEGSWCGLVPLGQPALVTTTGLKWNLSGQQMKFGDLISTSNTYDGKSSEVSVDTDAPLLYIMGIKKQEA